MLFFFANPGFVAGAIEAANHLNVGLFAYHVPTGDVTAVNRIAKVWLANGKPADQDPRRTDRLAPTRTGVNRAWFFALCFGLIVAAMVGCAFQAASESASTRLVFVGGAILLCIPTIICIGAAITGERMLWRSEGPMRLPTAR